MAEPTDYYGLVEDVVEADPQRVGTRSYLLLDCVRSDRFNSDPVRTIEDPAALALVRAMSTPKRWAEQFRLGEIAKGEWLSFRIDDSGGVPRAWELRADIGYAAGPSRSINAMRRIGGLPAATQSGDDALVMNLTAAISTPLKQRPRLSASAAMQKLDLIGSIEIVVLDVGQASAALIKRDGLPIGFFDVGAPIWFNKGSLPKTMIWPTVPSGFVILSHWDFDHFDLGRRHLPYRQLDWFAPDQPVGPNTALFQKNLGSQLIFIDGTASAGGFSLARGTSITANDRNGTGYQLRYEAGGRAVLLTGDTTYDLIQSCMLAGIGGLTIPHHAGRSQASPPAPIDPGRAIASYGDPNSYRHPHAQTIANHTSQGWRISTTATMSPLPRGDRLLYP